MVSRKNRVEIEHFVQVSNPLKIILGIEFELDF